MRNRTLDRILVTGVMIACSAAGTALLPLPSDARPPRPPTARDHFVFDPEHLASRVDAYRGRFERVTLHNTLETQVTEGEPICRLRWKGRRVDLFLDAGATSGTLDIPLPRGAALDDLEVYVIESDGVHGEEVDAPAVETLADTLRIRVPELGEARVVEVTYELEGTGISVDESFLFQPPWPVLSSQYRFSVSRDLWQKAADNGLDWEFQARPEPGSWQPQRDDSPAFFSWYWRMTNGEPLEEPAAGPPRSVTVTGFLPVPALAAFDPSNLPDVESLHDVMAFEEELSRQFEADQREGRSGPGIPRTSGSSVGRSDKQVLIEGGGK